MCVFHGPFDIKKRTSFCPLSYGEGGWFLGTVVPSDPVSSVSLQFDIKVRDLPRQ